MTPEALAYIIPAPPEQVFASEVQKLREDKFFPKEQLTLGRFTAQGVVQWIVH